MRPRTVPTSLVPATSPNWIELRPGWRVRVVIPMLRSGGYIVKTKPLRVSGPPSLNAANEITLSAGKDFIGYEVSWYSVKARRGGGVRVTFDSSEIHRQGQVVHSRRTIMPLFRLPRDARWVRILYLIEGNPVHPVDHAAAILAADRPDVLEAFTHRVQSDHSACRIGRHLFCSWIPRGIAVIPKPESAGQGKLRM
ncbi:MAG TPA: hypothetical protein VMI06_08735 [Terriglobia bacterium]|nr:hypothetical protein [Terriglobia bacterium]